MLISKIVAIAEITSNAIYLKIVERKRGKLNTLEYLKREIDIGRDSFSKRTINFEKVTRIANILQKFKEAAQNYGVEEIKAYATTAIRDAKNREYIIDQIKIKTGIRVRWLDDSEEKLYIYKEMLRYIKTNPKVEKGEALLTYIGTGSVGLALYKDKKIIFNQDILIGSLKLDEILGDVKNRTDKYYLLVDEYLSTFTYMLAKILPAADIDYFLVSGREIGTIAKICKAEIFDDYTIISKEIFYDLYEKIKCKTSDIIAEVFDIPYYRADILLPSMGIYNALFNLTSAKSFISPKAKLIDSIVLEYFEEKENEMLLKEIEGSTITVAKNIGERYNYDEKHAAQVEYLAITIFDRLKKIHGMGNREKLLLRVASILHDIGKYINIRGHYNHSYALIVASDIIGLNDREKDIIANISRYHSKLLPTSEQRSYQKLKIKDRLLMSKLAAILRLADALDRSHKQKVKKLEIKKNENEIIFKAFISSSINLDELVFEEKAVFFGEVFGIKAILKKKGEINGLR